MRRDNEQQFRADDFSFGEVLERERRIREELRLAKEHEETKDAWNRFTGSGKIGDYLDYLRESGFTGRG